MMKNVLLNPPKYANSYTPDIDLFGHPKKPQKSGPQNQRAIATIAPGEELKCSAILPTIALSKRGIENHDHKRSSSKEYGRPNNQKFMRKTKGGHLYKSIKSIHPQKISQDEPIQDYVALKMEVMRGASAENISDNRNQGENVLANKAQKFINKARGLKPVESSPEQETAGFVPLKKLNNEPGGMEKSATLKLNDYKEKFASLPDQNIEKHEPRCIMCDEQGCSFKDVSLGCLLEDRPVVDPNIFRDYLDKVLDSTEKTVDLKNIHNADPVSNDEFLPNPKEPRPATKYNKVMKEVDIKYKKHLLSQILKVLPDTYNSKLRLIHNTLEVVTDKFNNIVIRPKKRSRAKPQILKQHNTMEAIATPKRQTIRAPAKRLHTSSVEGENEEIKQAAPLISQKRSAKKSTLDSTRDSTDESDFSRVSMREYKSKKPSTAIKVLQKDYDHLANHEINQAIGCVNHFIMLTFRNKEKTYDVETILKLAKAMKLTNLTKKNICADTFKRGEAAYIMKENIIKYLASVINKCNNFEPTSLENEAGAPKNNTYKFYVAKGNNGIMVREVLKQRAWWSYGARHDENLNLLWTQWCRPKFIKELKCYGKGKNEGPLKVSNHFERHYHLSNKKAMFINLYRYYQLNNEDPFITLPLTFHIREGVGDPEFAKFTEYYNKLAVAIKETQGKKGPDGKKIKPERNIWIIKPGEYSNRGVGISVMQEYGEIKSFIGSSKGPHTYILQKYIEKPLLVNKRKFDIRMYGMLTSVNGIIKGYFYEEGYIRTSCKEYTLKNLANKTIHLTNDAVQKKDEDYGKYENGNKLSFTEFQRYLDQNYGSLNIDFYRDILPQIKVFF